MGVIVRKTAPVGSVAQAISSSIEGHMFDALMEVPPAGAAAGRQRALALTGPAAVAAAQAANQVPPKISIAWQPFGIALGLFFLLLAITIFVDWQNLVHDPKVYSGMATTLLGAVIGFMGGDATGTASSE